MFGAGWTEMLIIGIVALVVIGPKDLPVVMRKVGRVVATVRRMGGEFQRELNKTTGLDQIADLRRSLTEPLRQTSQEIAAEFNRQTATGVEPSGIVKPSDPKVESVYDQIAATSGVSPAETATATAATAAVGVADTTKKPARKPKAAKAVASAATAASTATTSQPAKAKPGKAAPAKTATAKKAVTAKKPATKRPSKAAPTTPVVTADLPPVVPPVADPAPVAAAPRRKPAAMKVAVPPATTESPATEPTLPPRPRARKA